MRLVVTDTSVFIDMEAGGLLEDMFRHGTIEFAVPDILYMEELAERHARLPGLGLQILTLSGEAIGDAEMLRQRYKKPSQNDLFALALAREQECSLLSGDADLRAAAEAEGVDIHGTIWLMEHLLNEQIITSARATAAYELMKADGSRLPWGEVQKQVKKWSGK